MKASADSSAAAQTGFRCRALRVLLIEDDESVREVTARWLRLQGFEVDVAADGEIGLARAIESSYDVMLLDWRLPRLHGAAVLRGLRLANVWVPVVVITQFAPEGAFEAAGLGAVGYLAKPLQFETLADEIRKIAAADRWCNRRSSPVLFSPCPVSSPIRLAAARQALDAVEERRKSTQRSHEGDVNLLKHSFSMELASADVTVFEFVGIAKGLHLMSARDLQVSRGIIRRLEVYLEEATERSARPLDARLAQTLSKLDGALTARTALSEADVAAALRIDRRTLLRGLQRELGLTFPGCRAIVVIRRAVLELATTREHVRQIAYDIGLTDAAVLNHWFRHFVGVTPTELRGLLRDT